MSDADEKDEDAVSGDEPLAGIDRDRRDFLKKMAGVAGVFAVPTVVAVTIDDAEAGAVTGDGGRWIYRRPDRGSLLERLLYWLRRLFGFGGPRPS